jgi:glycosyltransferase involved in cell wall biosynthesis
MRDRISIIVPTKNEPYIATLVQKLRKIFRNNAEIIVIEKGRKLPKVKAKVVRQRTNGLGNAFLEALKYAHGEIIANLDGDGSHRPEDLKKMIAEMKNADLAIGSRFVRGGKTKDVQHRQIASLFARKLASFIMGLNIEDSTSGFFVVRREVMEKIKVKKVLGYKMIFPIAYKAQQQNFRIKEVPITFVGRQAGTSHVSIFKLSGFKEIYNELKMAILLRLGLY